jgi:hypothetical protein
MLCDFRIDGKMASEFVTLLHGDGYVVALEDRRVQSADRRVRLVSVVSDGFLAVARPGSRWQGCTVELWGDDAKLEEQRIYAYGGPEAWFAFIYLQNPEWPLSRAVDAVVTLDGEWKTDREERAVHAASRRPEFALVRDLALEVMSDALPSDANTVIVLACALVKDGGDPVEAVQSVANEIRANVGLPPRAVVRRSRH